jgi:hypothetical protein
MVRHLRSWARGERQRGAALPLALGFLVLFTVLTAIVVGLVGTSFRTAKILDSRRNTVYAATSAINEAVARLRTDPTLGQSGGADCGVAQTTPANLDGNNVSVTCSTIGQSGIPQGSTQAPGFAILSLSGYHGPAPTTGCKNVNDELGIVQVQSKKLITINGNVYVNADVDSDLWSGGCPLTTTAQHPIVCGNIIHRESDHDLDLGTTATCGTGTGPYTAAQPVANPTPAQQALLADPAIANPAAWAPGVDANLSGPPTPDPQTVPSCPAGNLVTFSPGTYRDATAFNNLMNGSCPNRLFYFQPGNYWFDFTNSGTHEWSINDVTARVVGGQPYNGASTGSVVVGPTTWQPATATNGTTGFTNPNNAKVIDNNPATATLSTGTASISLSAFATNPASTVPANAVINSVRVRVAHAESATDADPSSVLNRIGTPTISVTSGTTACTTPSTFNVTPRTVLGEDAAPSYDVTSCLNTPTKVNNGIKVTYSVPKCVAGGTCDTTAASLRLDGIWVDITYTLPGRPAWDPTVPATVTSSTPLVPGACFHDGDGGAWTDGVQFIFNGDSRVNLRLGKLELCDKPATTHQEIVLYGRATNPLLTVGPKTWTAATVAQTTGTWTTPANAAAIDGATASTSFTNTTGSGGTNRTLTLSAYATNPAAAVPNNATITAATLRVAHSEGAKITSRTATITPGGASACGANTVTASTSLTTQSFDVLSCLNTPAKVNGMKLDYTAKYVCTSSCGTATLAALDGAQIDITYTVPATTNCITQTPYYNPADHSPAYQGACALLTVSGNPNQIGNDPTTWNVATFWGTVYAPTAALDIQPYDLQVPVFNRGFASRMAMLGYNPSGNAIVSLSTTPTVQTITLPRDVVLTAQVPNPAGNPAKFDVIRAEVKLCTGVDTSCGGTPVGNPATYAQIISWKVLG